MKLVVSALFLVQACLLIDGLKKVAEDKEWDGIVNLQVSDVEGAVNQVMSKDDYSIAVTKRTSVIGAQWPYGVIPYVIDSSISSKIKQLIEDSVKEFKKYTCIRWRRKNWNDKYYVRFESKKQGCFAPMGNPAKGNKKVNVINLNNAKCATHTVVMHEMCHNIGLHHEQTRYDRDKFVSFVKANVMAGKYDANFQDKANSRSEFDTYGTPYDYFSIMQYGAYFFSNNGKITIKTKDPKVQFLIGRMEHMSALDTQQINAYYKKQCRKAGTVKSYPSPPKFKCVDKPGVNCKYMIKEYTCSSKFGIYEQCCDSCRNGVKCKDTAKKDCGTYATNYSCTNNGAANYKYVDLYCCKTCKVKTGGGSRTSRGGSRTGGASRTSRGGRQTGGGSRGRGTGNGSTSRGIKTTCVDKDAQCANYKAQGLCTHRVFGEQVRKACCKACSQSG